MSLSSLIYHNNGGINCPNDLIQIMDVGNQLYSRLAHSADQSFLLLAELPSMLIVFHTENQVSYSESYTGNVHGNSAIEGYHYCMSLLGAFESLIYFGSKMHCCWNLLL